MRPFLSYRRSAVKFSFIFRNVECGTLHCQGGMLKPRLPQSTYSSHNQNFNDREVQCKMASGVVDPVTSADFGMVTDGTVCGNEMVSTHQFSLSLFTLTFQFCPSDLYECDVCQPKTIQELSKMPCGLQQQRMFRKRGTFKLQNVLCESRWITTFISDLFQREHLRLPSWFRRQGLFSRGCHVPTTLLHNCPSRLEPNSSISLRINTLQYLYTWVSACI